MVRQSSVSGLALLAVGVLSGLVAGQEPTSALDTIFSPPRLPTEELAERRGDERERERRREIETDRDSFTPSVTTASRRRLILESAYSFLDNRGRPETHSFPEFLARYGVGERFEVRLGWNYEVGGAGNTASGGSEGGESFEARLERESQVSYGFKAAVTEQRGWVPESAFLLMAFTPTSGPEPATQVVATGVFGWELPSRVKFDAAMRVGTDSERGDHFTSWAPSAVVKVPLGEKWNAHAEYFGIFSRDKERDSVIHYASPGLHYLITEDFEVGVRLGWGLNDQAARFFVNVGGGLRF